MARPCIILVPGMCSLGKVFGPLTTELRALGFNDIISVDHKSVDCLDHLDQLQPNALEADIAHLRSIIQTQVDADKEVILVAHSYGGTPSLYAAEGLWSHKRKEDGKLGGVQRTILLAASATSPGNSVAAERGAWAAAANVDLGDGKYGRMEMVNGQIPILHPDGLEEVWFNDLPDAEAVEWGRTLKPACLGNCISPTQHATVSDWRIAYLVLTERDLAMPEKLQRHLIDKARQAGATIDPVTTLDSGHFVQVTHAKEVAAWIRQVIA